ncbi:MAG: MaoC/PaaZ C-terminal domain-containing protein [Rhizomicrobium sp.]
MSVKPDWIHSFVVSEIDQTAFRDLSGDVNPLHFDAAFASRLGFEGPVVFGALIVAKVSGFLGATFPGRGCVWSKLAIDFRAPLYVNQEAVLNLTRSHSNDELGIWELSFTIVFGNAVIATGSVQVMRPRERR